MLQREMNITLGPIPFLWDREKIISFYKEILNTPVSAVYIGEVACSKRAILGTDTIEKIGNMLEDAGKEVVLSTLGLITGREEIEYTKSLLELPFAIEVNNIGALDLLTSNGSNNRRFITGPHIAVYNAATANFFHGLNVKRLVFMPELDRRSIGSISSTVPSVEKEIIGFGSLPVAFSWRCYTARSLALSKANCAIVCKKYPEGMPLETMDGMPIFNINGTQLMSAQKVCMAGELDTLKSLGIEYLRIIPQERHTADIIDTFGKLTEGVITGKDAVESLKVYSQDGLTNGWFNGQAGWKYIDKENPEPHTGEHSQSYLQIYPQQDY